MKKKMLTNMLDFSIDTRDENDSITNSRTQEPTCLVTKIPFSSTSFFELFTKMTQFDIILLSTPRFRCLTAARIAKFLKPSLQFFIYDLNIPTPKNTFRSKTNTLLRRILVKPANRLLTMHKDMSEYARLLHLRPSKFLHVGFKCNNFERLSTLNSNNVQNNENSRYILACGQSYRDYPTFIEAMRILPHIPTRILLPSKSNISLHGSLITKETTAIPPHIQVIYHDTKQASWDEQLRSCTAVVLPIRQECIQPAGISVYLEAMALNKPVVITHGTSTIGLLENNEASLVPP